MCFEVEGNGKGRMNSYFVVVFFYLWKLEKVVASNHKREIWGMSQDSISILMTEWEWGRDLGTKDEDLFLGYVETGLLMVNRIRFLADS